MHIHLVFKTHLDIGFTDLAAAVRRQYHERFIPQAIETGEHFHREDPEHPHFIWTTGAWLIADYLQTAERAAAARLERAIERGLIRWHALPFTTHSELMSPALFRAGLSFAAELDRRFGVATIAAKMTDVPGHALGIVPLLAEAGVRFLHIGVNTASPRPDVPDLFRWRAPGGAEVVVMYQHAYGATHIPDGFDIGLSFAHTSDNIGPQSVAQAVEAQRQLRAAHPEATVAAATLEDVAAPLWAGRAALPVVDAEIGDSWIHGVASDPIKTARFLALQRLYDDFAIGEMTPRRAAFGRKLTLVAEHTWGVDVKTFLRDETAWDRAAFEAARAADYRFAYTEASWQEQRAYLDAAVAELDDDDLAAAEAAVPVAAPAVLGAPVPVERAVALGGWSVTLDPETGDVVRLVAPRGLALDGRDGRLFGYRHESYDHADIVAQRDSYIVHRADWAILDHDKPGLQHAGTARSQSWSPRLRRVGRDGDRLVAAAEMPALAAQTLGAPAGVELTLRPLDDDHLEIALLLSEKPANRMPEAGFFAFTPEGATRWQSCKMGLWQAADRVVRRGGGGLQAVAAVRAALGGVELELAPLDTPLMAPAAAPFMRFAPEPPVFDAGIRFNLYNNKWGTNFPMWWSGDLAARFVLRTAA
jgi:hypothetical protein